MKSRHARDRMLLCIGLMCCFWLFCGIQKPVEAQETPHTVVAFDISSDGFLVIKGLSDRTIQLWDNQTNKLIATYAKPYPELGTDAQFNLNDLQFSPDNTQLAISFGDSVGAQNGFVWIFSIPDGKLLIELDAHGYGGSLAWQPDGQQLAVATAYGTGSLEEYGFRVWNTTDWSLQEDIQLPIELLAVLNWSPNGQILAVANGDLIELYDAKTWRILYTLKGHTDYIMSIDWNADSTKLAGAGLDQTIRIWDINSGTETQQFKRQKPATFSNIVLWSDDQQRVIALGDYNIEIWDTKSESLQANYDITPDWVVDAEKVSDKIVYLGGKSAAVLTLASLLQPEITPEVPT